MTDQLNQFQEEPSIRQTNIQPFVEMKSSESIKSQPAPLILSTIQVNIKKTTLKQDQCRVIQFQQVSQKEGEIFKNSYQKLPRFTKIEMFFEIVALIVFLVTWIYFQDQYSGLPNQVPVQFDIDGTPLRYDRKVFLYAFPVLETIVYILLSVLQFVPHRFKYQLPITVSNAQSFYKATRILLLYNKIITELVFCYLIFMMLRVLSFTSKPNIMYFVFGFGFFYLFGALRYQYVIKRITRL